MKNTFCISTFIFMLFISISGKSQSGMMVITDAVEYNDYVVKQQDLIGDELKIFMGILNDVNSEKSSALSELETVKGVISQSINNLKNLKKIEPDFDLTSNAINLFNFYKKTMETSYLEIINEIYSDSPDNDRMNKIINQITIDEVAYDNAFLGSQEKFAEKNNIKLE